MAKKTKVPKRRSFEALSLRIHIAKIIPNKRKIKEKKVTIRNLDIEL